MIVTRKFTLLAVMLMLATAGSALAGGFSIYEAGARATALGGAFTATADDASAIFYNPAGLSFLDGAVADVSLMPIIPGSKFTGAMPAVPPNRTGETADQIFPIPGLYYARPVSNLMTFGIGVYAPFGLGVKWADPETWVGRYSSYNVHLATIYVTPALSYKVNEQLAIAVGADIAWQKLELDRFSGVEFGGGADPMTNVIKAEMEGSSALNITPTFGAMYRPNEKLSFGLSYHHEKTMEYTDGDAVFSNVAPAALVPTVDGQLGVMGGTLNADGDYEFGLGTELGLPGILSLGVGYQLTPKLHAEVNAVYWTWSNFDALVLDFEQDGTELVDLDAEIVENYDDVWQWRLGFDYDAAPDWKLMAGYVRDGSPQPVESMGPLLPDADRNDFSFGVQHSVNNWRFTASYMAVLFEERSTVDDGEVTYFDIDDAAELADEIATRTYEAGIYDSIAHIFGFGVAYSF